MRIADVLPLTPLRQRPFFHANAAQGDDVFVAATVQVRVLVGMTAAPGHRS